MGSALQSVNFQLHSYKLINLLLLWPFCQLMELWGPRFFGDGRNSQSALRVTKIPLLCFHVTCNVDGSKLAIIMNFSLDYDIEHQQFLKWPHIVQVLVDNWCCCIFNLKKKKKNLRCYLRVDGRQITCGVQIDHVIYVFATNKIIIKKLAEGFVVWPNFGTNDRIYLYVVTTYTAKLLFHQSHMRHSDYTVTGQW